jgi:non-specific serine/threonine protein kinase
VYKRQTLQATVDWSYDLLSEQEKKVFHQLSVFVGGFDFEAYEQICRIESAAQEQLTDLLTSLVEKSLVITKTMESGAYRYQLLETIRHYAKEKLMESSESESIRESHYQYYYKLSEQAYKENARKFEFWVNRLELERENILAALEWVRFDIIKRLQLAAVLGWFWYEHSHIIAGLEYLRDAEKCPADATLIKARALTSHGFLSMLSGDLDGMQLVNSSLELWDKTEKKEEKVKSLFHYVIVKAAMQDFDVAGEVAREIGVIAQELNDQYLLLQSRTAQLWVYINQLQVDQAEPLAVQNMNDVIALNDKMMKPWNLHFYSDCALMRKDFEEAEKRYAVAMKSYLENGNQVESCVELQGIAFVLSGQKRYKKALRLQGTVDAKYDEYGVQTPNIKFWVDWFEHYINGARKAVGEEEAAQYEQEGRQMGFENAVEYALDFEKD